MNASPSIQTRLVSLADSLRQIQQLVSRLAKSAAQEDNGTHPELSNRLELADEIHSGLKEQEEDFELLLQDAQYYNNRSNLSSRNNTADERRDIDIATRLAKHGEDLKITRVQFRRAQLAAKRNAEAAQRKERDLLFADLRDSQSTSSPGYGRRKAQEKLSQDELALNTSSDLTASIRQLHGFMSAELERSQFARETLENSTKDLSSLSESYNNLDSLLSSSRSLVSTLISSQKSDTWYLESAFFVLVCTISWLAFRRLLYGPLWYLLYLPLKLVFWLVTPIATLVFGTSSFSLSAALGRQQSQGFQSAKGKADIPTFQPNMPEQTVRAGAGGQGAKAEPVKDGSQSLTQQVEKIIEAGQEEGKASESQETILRERRADEQPNPKKRMWEGPSGNVKGASTKDEL